MTTITSQFPEIERKDRVITLTTPATEQRKKYPTPFTTVSPTPLPTQTSAKSGNAEVRKSYWHYLPPINICSIIPPYQPINIEEKDRDSSHEITVYDAQPVGHQANSIKTDAKERRGRFVSDRRNNLSENLTRVHKTIEDTNPHKQRSQRLREYLDSLKNEAIVEGETEFSEKVLDLSWSVWEALKSRLFEERGLWLAVPDACPGSRDNFMYTWSKTEHYLECEIFGTGEIEFFYRNRNNGKVWGEDTTVEQGFSTDILDKTSIFIE